MQFIGMWEELSDEILEKIFSYLLKMKDIIAIEFVCSEWKRVAASDSLWKERCNKVWSRKSCPFLTVDAILPGVNYSPLVDQLSVKEIKYILQERKVKFHGIFEKEELVKLVQNSTPIHIRHCSDLIQSKWKANFATAALDSERIQITKEELCSLEWFDFYSFLIFLLLRDL